mgnify:FL=1
MGLLDKEQQAEHAEDKMAYHRLVVAYLEVVKADVAFAVFEQTLDVPAAEGYVEQDFGRGVGGCVGQEVFHLAGQDVAGDEEPA